VDRDTHLLVVIMVSVTGNMQLLSFNIN